MINEQIVFYIKSQIAQQVSIEEISSSLKSQGWSDADINEAFSVLQKQNSTSPIQSLNSTSKFKNIITLVLLGVLLLGAGYFFFIKNKNMDNNISETTNMNTNNALTNDSSRTNTTDNQNLNQPTSTNLPKTDVRTTSEDEVIVYSTPVEYKVNTSTVQTTRDGVSSDAIIMYEFVSRARSVLVIKKYLDQSLFEKSVTKLQDAGTYLLVDEKYMIDNISAMFYQDQEKYGSQEIVIPSKLVRISINSLSITGATQQEINEIISSIKFTKK